jgi:hypothetical protein
MHRLDGPEELTVPFEEKEMDEVVMSMPTDRALGQMASMLCSLIDAGLLFL